MEQLLEEGTLTKPDYFVGEKKPTTGDTSKYIDPNGSLKQFVNMATLFKMALLIPPIISNIEGGFSVMNLRMRTRERQLARQT